MEKPGFWERLNHWVKRSVTLKVLAIGFLVLILLIPTSLLTSLVSERQSLRDEAVVEVSSKWGSGQVIGGPVLTVPFRQNTRDEKGKVVQQLKYAHFLPDLLSIDAELEPEKRYRGIYVVVLYNSKIKVKGRFEKLNLRALNEPVDEWLWDEAFVSVGIPDMKGIKNEIKLTLNDSISEFGPGIPVHDIFASGISTPVKAVADKAMNFSFSLDLNGSSYIQFLPFGKKTQVSLSSTWSNPSFEGAFLPDKRDVTDKGFRANWQVLQLNRNYPQQGVGSFIGNEANTQYQEYGDKAYNTGMNQSSSFGVKLLLPIDEYKKTMRSAKYSIMFIILTFTTFFFIEVLNRKRLHPIQYLLVGFAICLFYVLLLSVSEHTSFATAYLTGSAVITALITFYCHGIFRKSKVTLLIMVQLVLLYGFFYSLLQLQDYSLLLGSLGLLIILATIMYLTRKIDWYHHSVEEEG